jgi:hypothetical protein
VRGIERRGKRPVFGWIALGLVLAGYATLAGAAFWAEQQTRDAFVQGPPWWVLTATVAAVPLGLLLFLGLVLGIVGAARREKPGWPAITAMILSLPGFGYLAFAGFVWFTVATSCSDVSGVCG